MNRKQPFNPRSSLARISIWTIINHDFLAARVRTYDGQKRKAIRN